MRLQLLCDQLGYVIFKSFPGGVREGQVVGVGADPQRLLLRCGRAAPQRRREYRPLR
jgi:hypothetical protein